jgi:DNA repair protein RadC
MLQKIGAEALSAQELLALVIGHGIPRKSVMNIAQELLARFGNIKVISQGTIEELSQIRGIGLAKAAQIKACFELGRREELFRGLKRMSLKCLTIPLGVPSPQRMI